MSLNTSHTPDGKGVLIYNGEMILLYSTGIKMKFGKYNNPLFKSAKSGALYLTSHRIIFMNDSSKDQFKSFAMPFHCLRDVKLEQPLLAPNYLRGWVEPLPGGNFDGCPEWKLSFPKGGCIEFGQALLRAAEIARNSRPFAAPPAYGESSKPAYNTTYYAAPSSNVHHGPYQGFQAPTNVFPEQPPAGNVYMYEIPPPYPGIGQTTPYPTGNLQPVGTVAYQNLPPYPAQPPQPGFTVGGNVQPPQNSQPPAYSAYQEAPPLPLKNGPL